MKIATWNVNSIRAREDVLFSWLERVRPDVLCLQETKVEDQDFPTDGFSRLGYEVATFGQRAYNGVAIAARMTLQEVTHGVHDDPVPGEARALSATAAGVRVVCVYVPNGKSVDAPSFQTKLSWLRGLRSTIDATVELEERLVVCGDFNVAPQDRDVYDPVRLQGQLHFHPAEHAALGELLSLGLDDVFRRHHSEGGLYTWWDYRAGAYRRNLGLRIDLMLASTTMAARCTGCDIDETPRAEPKPSDHAPVVAEFQD